MTWPSKIPKIAYFFWDDSPLPYLRYLSLFSFRYWNPQWKIQLFRPLYTIKNKTNMEIREIIPPHSIKYSGYDYSSELNKLDIEIKTIDFEEMGIMVGIPVVHRVAYLKYYLLSKGGVWSDMDILYLAPIENISIKEEHMISGNVQNLDTTVAFYRKDLVEITKEGFYYTGFMFASQDNEFYRDLYNEAFKYHDAEKYLSLDSDYIKKLYPDIKDIVKKYPNISLYNLDEASVYRYWWGDLNLLYNTPASQNPFLIDNINILHDKSVIGVHWFGGVPLSEIFINNIDRPLKQSGNNFNGIMNDLYFKYRNLDTKSIRVTQNIKKISIVMAYYNRRKELLTTLETIKKSKHPNYEIIIVDDASNKDNELSDLTVKYNINLIKLNKYEKKWCNPCIPYNMGFKHATGDIIIIQNPECCHIGDILTYVENNLNKNEYFAFSCFSSKSFVMNQQISHILFNEQDYQQKISSIINQHNGEEPYTWYNHQEYNPSGLNFLTAIYKEQLDKLGGFDTRYKNGYCFDDNDFLCKIKYELNLNIKIIPYLPHSLHLISQDYNVFCIHLYHDRNYVDHSVYQEKFNLNYNQFYNNHMEIVNNKLTRYSNYNMINNQIIIVTPKNNIKLVRNKNIDDITATFYIKNVPLKFLYDLDYTLLINSSADLNNYDFITNIKNILSNCEFYIEFYIKCNRDSFIYLYNGELEYEFPISTTLKKINLATKLTMNKWYFSIKNPEVTIIEINKMNIRVNNNFRSIISIPNFVYDAKNWKLKKIPKKAYAYWGGPLSYLHYLTIKSFLKYNPDWQFTLYEPSVVFNGEKTWSTLEHSVKYTGKDYRQDLCKLGIKSKIIDFTSIGFSNEVPETFKSDYIRLHQLYHNGGVWIDMDILFINSLNTLSFNKDNIYGDYSNIDVVLCCYEGNHKDDPETYYPTGLLMSSKNCDFYKMLLDKFKENFEPSNYMSTSNLLLKKLFVNIQDLRLKLPALKFANLDMNSVYPYKWHQVNRLYNNNNIINITSNTIGIHWCNALPASKYFINQQNYDNNTIINYVIKNYIE